MKLNVLFQILLLEAGSHLGGWIQTSQFDDGTVFESGPRSIRGVGRAGYNSLELVSRKKTSFRIIMCESSCITDMLKFYCIHHVHVNVYSCLTDSEAKES